MNTDLDRLHRVGDAIRDGIALPRRSGKTTYLLHCVCGYTMLGLDVAIVVPCTQYIEWMLTMLKDIAVEYDISLYKTRNTPRHEYHLGDKMVRFIVCRDRNEVDMKLRGLNDMVVTELNELGENYYYD